MTKKEISFSDLMAKGIVRIKVNWILEQLKELKERLNQSKKNGNFQQYVISDELLKELLWFEDLVRKTFADILENEVEKK